MTIRYGGIDKRDVVDRKAALARRMRAAGRSVRDIAAEIGCSKNTVKEYVSRALGEIVPYRGDTDWAELAVCAQQENLDICFPEVSTNHPQWREAKEMCATCPVRNQCLEYALRNDERWGVWGGLLPEERQRLMKGAA